MSLPRKPKTGTFEEIARFGQSLGNLFRPERVVLFGSFAHGTPNPDSDVDILVIMPFEGSSAARAAEMRLRLRPRFPLDLLVRTPGKIRERLQLGDPFVSDILATGKVLYETPDR